MTRLFECYLPAYNQPANTKTIDLCIYIGGDSIRSEDGVGQLSIAESRRKLSTRSDYRESDLEEKILHATLTMLRSVGPHMFLSRLANLVRLYQVLGEACPAWISRTPLVHHTHVHVDYIHASSGGQSTMAAGYGDVVPPFIPGKYSSRYL